ncbi:40S ribosomal protein [Desmophyllum pertusum]|uniref:40S ribosomal protein n=1 Tax=Desmophyllum pertusum TaxID=174260 RepID=A0A9W9ZWC6_9CNID|nr:40S ribosomal protein [Desmophyllum pertusum]
MDQVLLRCLESIDSNQRSIKESHCFHSSALMLKARSRREWRKDRPPALTRLSPDLPEEIEPRKAYGGHKKIKAIKSNQGLYVWNSLDVELECPILKVVHNTANKDFNEMGVVVKGTIVEVDSNPFKTWYSSNYNNDKSKEGNSSLEHLLPYMERGQLYAKITSRPGQVGACNGYILEGDELESLFNTREDLRLSLQNSAGGQ